MVQRREGIESLMTGGLNGRWLRVGSLIAPDTEDRAQQRALMQGLILRRAPILGMNRERIATRSGLR